MSQGYEYQIGTSETNSRGVYKQGELSSGTSS